MDQLKRLAEKSRDLSDMQVIVIHLLLIVGWISLGLYLAPTPSKDDICHVEMGKIKTKDIKIGNLEAQVTTLQGEVDECIDRCGTKLRDELDLQEKRQGVKEAEALRKQKTRLAKFRCDRCKRQGLCK